MPQAVDLRLKANSLCATPMITAETSWEHFKWHLEYHAGLEADSETSSRLHVVRALGQDQRMRWLGNAPPETVLEIRKSGQAPELREILSRGIESLVKINPENYARTSKAVADNIQREFDRHQAALDQALDQKLKFYGLDVASAMVVGGLAVAAAITSNPLLGGVSGVLGIAGAPNLRELRSRYRELREADVERGKSATALLFGHAKG